LTVRWMIAVTALAAAAMASAEPAPPSASDSDHQPNREARVVLASAEQDPNAESPVPEAQPPATPAKKPRAARVTTCRCGDPG